MIGTIDAVRTLVLVLAAALASGGTVLALGVLGSPEVTGAGSDFGLDTDGNGKFDWLVVEASVVLPETGLWDAYASLLGEGTPSSGPCSFGYPRPGMETFAPWPISSVYERYFFESGLQTVRLAFSGTDIARAGIDGPFAVQATFSIGGPIVYYDTGILPPERESPYVMWNYTTGAYLATDFDAPVRPVVFTGDHADEGVHVDDDGLYDLFVLSAGVHVTSPGSYGLSGMITSHANATDPYVVATIAYAYRDVRLEATDTRVSLPFRGDQIRMAGIDGPWDFLLTLYPTDPYPYAGRNGTIPSDPAGHPVVMYPEILCGATGPHRASAFDDTAELLRYTGAFEEAARDWDGDGLYDALIVRAQLESFASAGFDFAGTLRSSDGSRDIARFGAQAYLPAGLSWTEWSFPGGSIASAGIDGPYEAVLSITPSAMGVDPTTTYITKAYRAADFGEGGNGTHTRTHWISDLQAVPGDSGSLRISVGVVRGDDLLTVVLEDVLTVTVYDASRNEVFRIQDRVSLPSGGSTQAFGYAVDGLSRGTYTVVATLGDPAAPGDVRAVTVSL